MNWTARDGTSMKIDSLVFRWVELGFLWLLPLADSRAYTEPVDGTEPGTAF
jgi:hypothetical protein